VWKEGKPLTSSDKSRKRRYAIIGSGALGGLYGGRLAHAGFDVHFLLHSDYDHVCQHGLKVESPWGDFHLSKVNAHASADTMPPCDVTVVALKTTNNHLLSELLPAPTRGGGVVLVLQNGLGIEADSSAVVDSQDSPSRVLSGCCFLCSNKVGPGHIRHLDHGRIVFGDWQQVDDQSRKKSISPIANEICSDLESAGIDAQTTDDVALTRWRKLLWNIPFNGLSVVLNASTKELIDNDDATELARSVMIEVRDAAAACGIIIPIEMIDKTIDSTRNMVPYDSSMRLDFLAGRPMEIDAMFSAPIHRAAQAGFAMPIVETIRRQLLFNGRRR
jgi:2-dehydropantoate 2-reductase